MSLSRRQRCLDDHPQTLDPLAPAFSGDELLDYSRKAGVLGAAAAASDWASQSRGGEGPARRLLARYDGVRDVNWRRIVAVFAVTCASTWSLPALSRTLRNTPQTGGNYMTTLELEHEEAGAVLPERDTLAFLNLIFVKQTAVAVNLNFGDYTSQNATAANVALISAS
jgi:hypothetical protein